MPQPTAHGRAYSRTAWHGCVSQAGGGGHEGVDHSATKRHHRPDGDEAGWHVAVMESAGVAVVCGFAI
jgi:hypothetical protein